MKTQAWNGEEKATKKPSPKSLPSVADSISEQRKTQYSLVFDLDCFVLNPTTTLYEYKTLAFNDDKRGTSLLEV